MTDSDKEGPLSSEELEDDRARAGTDSLAGAEEAGAAGPASEREAADGGADAGTPRPNPIAGTMLPPD
jgi:hypothetical protein